LAFFDAGLIFLSCDLFLYCHWKKPFLKNIKAHASKNQNNNDNLAENDIDNADCQNYIETEGPVKFSANLCIS